MLFRRQATSRAALHAGDSSPPKSSIPISPSFSEAPVSLGTLVSIPSSQMSTSSVFSTGACAGLSEKGKALFVEVVSADELTNGDQVHSELLLDSGEAPMPLCLAAWLQGRHGTEVATNSGSDMKHRSQQRSLGETSPLVQHTDGTNTSDNVSKQIYGLRDHQESPPMQSCDDDDASQLASRLAYRKLARAKAAAARERAAWARVEQAACEAPLKELPGFPATSSRVATLPLPHPRSSSTSSAPRRASSPRSQSRNTSPRNSSSGDAAVNATKFSNTTTPASSKTTPSLQQQQQRRSGGSAAGSRESPEALDATRKAASARARARRASRGVGVDGRVPSSDLGLFRRSLIGGVGNTSHSGANPNGSRHRCGGAPGSPRAENGGTSSEAPVKRGSPRARVRGSAACRQQATSAGLKASPSSSSCTSSGSGSSPSSSESSASPQAGKPSSLQRRAPLKVFPGSVRSPDISARNI